MIDEGGAGAWSACCAPHTLESSSLLPWPCRARTSNSHPPPPAPLLAEPPHQAKTFACALSELINTDISANSLQPGGEAPLAAQQQWHSPLWAVWLDVPLNCWGLLCPSCLYADSVTRLDGRCAMEGENACVQRVARMPRTQPRHLAARPPAPPRTPVIRAAAGTRPGARRALHTAAPAPSSPAHVSGTPPPLCGTLQSARVARACCVPGANPTCRPARCFSFLAPLPACAAAL